MSNAQRGAYIDLLCTAWTEESCTLPAEIDTLQKLSHWEGTAEEFHPVLACFPLTRNKKRRHNPRLFAERQEALAYRTKQSEGGRKGMEARWAEKPTVRKQRKVETLPPRDWLAELQALPLYSHVNWERELGKINVWHAAAENKHRIINRKFVVGWVNKIEPPLSNGHGTSLVCPHHPTLTFADKKAKDTHDYLHHPKYVG